MKDRKAMADRLRKVDCIYSTTFDCELFAALEGTENCGSMDCRECRKHICDTIARTIEAEQTVDVNALSLLCDKLEVGSEKSRDVAAQIRAALNGAERSKTEHDGVDVDALLEVAYLIEGTRVELIERANAVANAKGAYVNCIVTMPTAKMQEWADTIRDAVKGANASNSMPLPEGLNMPADADGAPCHLDDAVWLDGRKCLVVAISHKGKVCVRDWETRDSGKGATWAKAERVSHRRPDTFESVAAEMVAAIEGNDDGPEIGSYIERFRKLLGGE